MSAPTKNACDIIVRNGCVLTLDADRTVYADGAIAIRGNAIAAVGSDAEISRSWQATREIAAQGSR